MRAVVKDDERPHQEAGGRKHQHERQQIRDIKREIHQDGNGQVRHDRGEDLEHASPETGTGVGGKRFMPEPAIRSMQSDHSSAGG